MPSFGEPQGLRGSVLVIGGGITGIETSLNLTSAGYKVYLADRKPNLGGNMAQLDKVFPTNDCSMCIMAPKLVEAGRDRNISLLMNSEVVSLEGEEGDFTVTLRTRPRRVDPAKCTSCGECSLACPLEVGNVYNENLSRRSAAFINFPQAIPSTYMIDRQLAPCIFTCPVNLNARDYIGLIAEGKFLDALDLIRERLPFPGVMGRICTHPCESQCLRGRAVDQPLAICALKRFVADYECTVREMPVPPAGEEKGKDVAIIGGGPAGAACAIELRKAGYGVTIFEAHDRMGGMLYVGVPRYRLPEDVLMREFALVEKMGAKVRYGTRVGTAIALSEVFDAFDGTFIASGAHGRRKLGLENEDAPGVLNALDVLRQVNTEGPFLPGRRVIVVGGGNVAMDTALTARRCGAVEVDVVALEQWDAMPAHRWEVDQALEEGIVFHNGWGPGRIDVEDGRFSGLELYQCLSVFDEAGRFKPVFDDSLREYLSADTLILVIYETIDTAYLSASDEIDRHDDGRIMVDPVTLETTKKGVFAGGNAATGPRSAIEAIAQGKRAAESIIRHLEGRDLRAGRLAEDDKILDEVPRPAKRQVRAYVQRRPLAERSGFDEISLPLSESAAVDEARRCLSCRRCLGCKICEEACEPKAIDFSGQPVEERVRVGSIIIATGFDEFDPSSMKNLGYGLCRNVVTSVEYERMLSATGPTAAVVMRPSDGRIPGKVAFLQCVGSRDERHPYCSSVCCMYATEEAVISKEHHRHMETVIFYNDMRAFAKGYEEQVRRARNDHGVRYVRSLVSRVLEDPLTGDVTIRYVDEKGERAEEVFGLVVLSVGLRPSKHLARAAAVLGIDVTDQGFVRTDPLRPLATSKRGIFVCGAAESPKDITESVTDGCAAACEAVRGLQEARWSEIETPLLPDERSVEGEDPRIGVFICRCGVNIGGTVDVDGVRQYAEGLPAVVVAEENLFTCSQDTQDRIGRTIREKGLNRVVVASCSTRTHEPLFQDLIRRSGLNRYLFEMANIRDQCSWVHMNDHRRATDKAKTLVRMAVAASGRLTPLAGLDMAVTKRALVIGGGLAGMTAAQALADQGVEVDLVERSSYLGGHCRHLLRTLDGTDVRAMVDGLVATILAHRRITVLCESDVTGFSGTKGSFTAEVTSRLRPEKISISAGAVIVATGGHELKPFGAFLYGSDNRVMTQTELEVRLSESPLPSWRRIVMIQCVGSRNRERPYCSRVCCMSAVKNALTLTDMLPGCHVTVFFRDMMTYGFHESYYKEARRRGVRFVRYDGDNPPEVALSEGRLSVVSRAVSGTAKTVSDADLVCLSTAVIPDDDGRLPSLMKLPKTENGFLLEAHAKLRPVDMAAEGLFLAGLCHSPRTMGETIVQARAAAGRALTILSRDSLIASGVVAQVDRDRCAACLTCVRVCPFRVPVINGKGEAEISAAACRGCGTCAAECPAQAIDLCGFSDLQVREKTAALCT